MKKTLLVLPFFLLSCQVTNSFQNELKQIEDYIQDDPRKALEELNSLNTSTKASSSGNHALYSLLYSIALDKNYIDVKSDSIISYAVHYYGQDGDIYHRFLTYYYHGRVMENAEDYSEAIKSFIKAERCVGRSIPLEYQSRLFSAKARVYVHQFALDKALQSARQAMRVSESLENPQFYIHNCLDVASLSFSSKKYSETEAVLDSLEQWMNVRSLDYSSDFFKTRLRIEITRENKDKLAIQQMLSNYLEVASLERRSVNHLLCCEAYTALGDTENAIKELGFISSTSAFTLFELAEYHHTRSNLFEMIGNYKDAFFARIDYHTVLDNINLDTFNNDVRFLEERLAAEREKRHSVIVKSILCMIAFVLLFVIIFLINRSLKKKQDYEHSLLEAKMEFDFIKKIMNSCASDNTSVESVLEYRLRSLQPYLLYDGHSIQLNKLSQNAEHLLESVGLMCALTHYRFVEALVQYDLTASEIGLCAMYLADYQPKQLTNVIGKSSLYHRNVTIRRKLPDSIKGTTLSSWLDKLFQETEQQEIVTKDFNREG